jgi:hypothetical protein
MDIPIDLFSSGKLRALKPSKEQFIANKIFDSVINFASSPYAPNELIYSIDSIPIGYLSLEQFKLSISSLNNLVFDIIKLLKLKFKDDISIFIMYKFNCIDDKTPVDNYIKPIDNLLQNKFNAIHSDDQKIKVILENYRINSVDLNICIKW